MTVHLAQTYRRVAETMSEEDNYSFEISRRKTLAALGTIGAASAGAGLGTSAWFSDTETFEGNTLTAGSLDLKVDWEEHYYDGSAGSEYVEWIDGGESPPDGRRAFATTADGSAPRATVAYEDVDAFMRANAVEAMPDVDGDNLADGGYYDVQNDETEEEWEISECDDYPDPDDLERPLIEIGDLKPGDFGEITFSLHLCDNPGYLWANTMDVAWAEKGHTEPEAEDEDSVGPADEMGSTAEGDSLSDAQVELLDTVQASVFYDDGNNLFDTAQENPSCIGFVLDDSGSMGGTKAEQTRIGAKAAVNQLDADDDGDIDPHDAAVVTFGSGSTLQQGLTNDVGDLEAAIDEVDGDSGLTNMSAAIEDAAGEMAECEQDNKVMVILSNGAENIGDARAAAQQAVDDDVVDTFFTIGVQAGTAGDDLLQDIADLSPSGMGTFLDVTDPAQIAAAFGELVRALGGDIEIASGTLREILQAMMADPEAGDWGVELDGFPATEERDPFINSTTAFIGFEWWVPVDHGNEIQTDMVEFDLGFYAEQFRHNDGAGLPAENETAVNATNETGQ